ncbi:bifunctional folylpolyglutamate synthase/dihydrofolate synthase [Sphingomonas sp.]|uniref:bifunctional folylpolyglutamate synthase/dihydrofolate synthase n=1 Tax=Sphingomonas sp. TaxID=28214 RepID=UPI0035C7F81F
MPDHATSSHRGVQAQLDRLWSLSPGADVLGLDRITRLLARLGDPHLRLPPVFHVAGTNGKGSTCAYLRAVLEAAGYRVHGYTSPHLVRFNERIRLAGRLIDDEALATVLSEVLDRGGDIGASFFEVTTAAAFLAFAQVPADACVIEVGLGGRLDATNVVRDPVAGGIAALGIDHQSFLGDTIEQIAAEKAGIAKPGMPLLTMRYTPPVREVVASVAHAAGATWIESGRDWRFAVDGDAIRYSDAAGDLRLPFPALPGAHQADNYALAVAMLRHQRTMAISHDALGLAAHRARWPARLQRLGQGPLVTPLGGVPVWLDGGHNASAGAAIGAALGGLIDERPRPLTVVLGMLANKDPAGFLTPFSDRIGRLIALPVPGHAHHAPEALAALARSLGIPEAVTATDIRAAMAMSASRGPQAVLIAGSLYLAGDTLAANDELPD